MTRFGVEEEFVLLDEQTLVPAAMSAETRERILSEASAGVTPEYLTCQIETATEPCLTRADAEVQLRRTRGRLGSHASAQYAMFAGTGTPFISPNRFAVSRSAHYDAVAGQLAEITREHVSEPLDVLHRQRLVEAVGLPNRLDLLRRGATD